MSDHKRLQTPYSDPVDPDFFGIIHLVENLRKICKFYENLQNFQEDLF